MLSITNTIYLCYLNDSFRLMTTLLSYAAAASLQSCLTLCDPIDGSPPGSLVPGILQARTLEWVAICFSNAWEWKVKVKSLSHVWLFEIPWTVSYQDPVHGIFPGKSTGVGCHFLPPFCFIGKGNFKKFSQWFSFYWISSFINFIFLQSVSYCDCIAIREISLLQVSLQCESGLIK